jgi:hypothetical protein
MANGYNPIHSVIQKSNMRLIGFDPGGQKAFGWAVLDITSDSPLSLRTGVVSSVPQAIAEVKPDPNCPVVGIGIDAPLFWVPAGDRKADAYVRKRVIAAGGSSGTVSSINSLQGACLAQGILAARAAAATWPEALITEAHPKALLRLHGAAQEFVEKHVPCSTVEHERDAALAAFAAWCAVVKRPEWQNLVRLEEELFFPGGNAVDYWFPSGDH